MRASRFWPFRCGPIIKLPEHRRKIIEVRENRLKQLLGKTKAATQKSAKCIRVYAIGKDMVVEIGAFESDVANKSGWFGLQSRLGWARRKTPSEEIKGRWYGILLGFWPQVQRFLRKRIPPKQQKDRYKLWDNRDAHSLVLNFVALLHFFHKAHQPPRNPNSDLYIIEDARTKLNWVTYRGSPSPQSINIPHTG